MKIEVEYYDADGLPYPELQELRNYVNIPGIFGISNTASYAPIEES